MSKPNEKSYILETRSATTSTSIQQGASSDAVENNANPEEGSDYATDDDFQDRSSLSLTSFNYINSIIGSGIIGMPYALKQAGFGLGVILMVVVAIVTDYSLILLVRGGNLAGTNTYQGLVEAAFGKIGFYILAAIQFFYPVIAMISYNIIIADTITKVLVRVTKTSLYGLLGNRYFIVILSTLLVTMPLSLYRKISKLAKASMLSLVFIFIILISIMYRVYTLGPKIPASEDAWQFGNTGVTQAIGIMAFAFMCHHNTFLIYGSLENPTQTRWNKVTHWSVFTALIMFLILGIAGYSTFTGYSQGDVLENYCLNDDFMNLSRFLFSVTIMLTYPIECFVAREVIESTFFTYTKNPPLSRHLIVTLTIGLLTAFVSMTTDCLGIVLELNGVLAAVPLAYIFPALCYLRIEQGPLFSTKKLPAFVTCMFGVVVAASGVVLTLYQWSQSSSCVHGDQIGYCTAPASFDNSSSSSMTRQPLSFNTTN